MTDVALSMDEDAGANEATRIFEREIGATGVDARKVQVGNRAFLRFVVGKDAPLYEYAVLQTQKALSPDNPFRGALGIHTLRQPTFPNSLEANAVLTLLTRSTRPIAQDPTEGGFSVPYIPFRNREDHQVAQPASHIVTGRRGVGKSTLIRRAAALLKSTPSVVAVLDMQSYATVSRGDVAREVLHDMLVALADSADEVAARESLTLNTGKLRALADGVLKGAVAAANAPPASKRALSEVTRALKGDAFVFLDDYHLIDPEAQPSLAHVIHGVLKGARGWLKISGLRSLLNYYSAKTREGLQVPGDAQPISLDLTLENPEAAETHLKAILDSFLHAVGYSASESVIPETAFRRLVWANAGVPRDFLQMFARALEHAQRNRHAAVTLSDVNMAVGEFGQRKLDDLQQDARNAAGELRNTLDALESYCLDRPNDKVNAFLVRSEDSEERRLIHILSDLRMVHLIQQSITPGKAGKRYEAYVLDYSLFTGFRRRQNVHEMVPDAGQFKAAELRKLPKIAAGFLAKRKSGVQILVRAPSRKRGGRRLTSRSRRRPRKGRA